MSGVHCSYTSCCDLNPEKSSNVSIEYHSGERMYTIKNTRNNVLSMFQKIETKKYLKSSEHS